MQDLLIKNGKVLMYTKDDIIIEKKDILVQNGVITKIDERLDDKEGLKIIDATNHIVMPGLINTHAHIPMSIFRETTEGCKLYEWLNEKIWPREDKLTEEDVYYASMLTYFEMISTGTTCINDQYFFNNAIRKSAEECKVRAVLTRTLIDTDNSYENRIQEFREFYNSRNENDTLITYSVAPHALYTCSDKCLKEASNLAREYNLPIHVHFLESIDEIEDIKNKHKKSAIEVLKENFDGIHTILAHAVHLTDADISILKTMDVRNCT